MTIKGFTNPEICSECKGQCCKKISGAYIPEDILKIPFDKFIDMLLKHELTVDSYEEASGLYDEEGLSIWENRHYFRPPVEEDCNFLFSYTFKSSCIWLTDDGCKLQFEDRPYQCRMLEPKKVNGELECITHNGCNNSDISKQWIPYQEGFDQLYNIFVRGE